MIWAGSDGDSKALELEGRKEENQRPRWEAPWCWEKWKGCSDQQLRRVAVGNVIAAQVDADARALLLLTTAGGDADLQREITGDARAQVGRAKGAVAAALLSGSDGSDARCRGGGWRCGRGGNWCDRCFAAVAGWLGSGVRHENELMGNTKRPPGRGDEWGPVVWELVGQAGGAVVICGLLPGQWRQARAGQGSRSLNPERSEAPAGVRSSTGKQGSTGRQGGASGQ